MGGEGVGANDAAPHATPALDGSPFAALPALRRAAYAPGASAATVAEAERLTALLAEEQQRTERAVAAAAPAQASASSPPEIPPASALRRSGRRAVLHAGIAAVVGIALGIGIGIGAIEPRGGPSTPAIRLTESASGVASLDSLQRAQRPSDIPLTSLRGAVEQSSLRRLVVDPTNGEGVYAARDSGGQVCLLRARSMYTVSCVGRDTFARYGLEIRWAAIVVGVHDTTAQGEGKLIIFAAQWQPNGRVQVGVVAP